MLCKKIVTCLVCMLVLTSVLMVVNNVKNNTVNASDDGGGPAVNGAIGLNYSYMWNVTKNLSNAAHSYPVGMIPKGRAFGSWGCENYSANYIYNEMINLSLSNVTKEKLGPLEDYPARFYTSFMDVTGYRLTIERDGYTLPRNVPLSESGAMPSNECLRYLINRCLSGPFWSCRPVTWASKDGCGSG